MTPSAEGPTSPGSESRAVRQLLYTNADRVVDGVKTGGWQILEQSPALDDVTASRLLALVEPRLNPVSPLSGFPTPEEIAALTAVVSMMQANAPQKEQNSLVGAASRILNRGQRLGASLRPGPGSWRRARPM